MKVGDIVRRRGKRSLSTLEYKPRERSDYYDELGIIISVTDSVEFYGDSMFKYPNAKVRWTRSGTTQEMGFMLEVVQEYT